MRQWSEKATQFGSKVEAAWQQLLLFVVLYNWWFPLWKELVMKWHHQKWVCLKPIEHFSGDTIHSNWRGLYHVGWRFLTFKDNTSIWIKSEPSRETWIPTPTQHEHLTPTSFLIKNAHVEFATPVWYMTTTNRAEPTRGNVEYAKLPFQTLLWENISHFENSHPHSSHTHHLRPPCHFPMSHYWGAVWDI